MTTYRNNLSYRNARQFDGQGEAPASYVINLTGATAVNGQLPAAARTARNLTATQAPRNLTNPTVPRNLT